MLSYLIDPQHKSFKLSSQFAKAHKIVPKSENASIKFSQDVNEPSEAHILNLERVSSRSYHHDESESGISGLEHESSHQKIHFTVVKEGQEDYSEQNLPDPFEIHLGLDSHPEMPNLDRFSAGDQHDLVGFDLLEVEPQPDLNMKYQGISDIQEITPYLELDPKLQKFETKDDGLNVCSSEDHEYGSLSQRRCAIVKKCIEDPRSIAFDDYRNLNHLNQVQGLSFLSLGLGALIPLWASKTKRKFRSRNSKIWAGLVTAQIFCLGLHIFYSDKNRKFVNHLDKNYFANATLKQISQTSKV
ncbi:unnamed protein product [Moneuplotes crassus]|uniref:Uncharacterized protein n=1 Tax=Euplotes crassus TaxID=5936 RepID=A0AAD1XLR1_EUPCR|nr:unnamed protein product [Moneuplotes crassus]